MHHWHPPIEDSTKTGFDVPVIKVTEVPIAQRLLVQAKVCTVTGVPREMLEVETLSD